MDIPGKKAEDAPANGAETAPVTPAVTPVSEAPKAAPTASQDSPPVPFKNRTPAHWHIEVVPDSDEIEAINNVSGERFSGTIAQFNAALRA